MCHVSYSPDFLWFVVEKVYSQSLVWLRFVKARVACISKEKPEKLVSAAIKFDKNQWECSPLEIILWNGQKKQKDQK